MIGSLNGQEGWCMFEDTVGGGEKENAVRRAELAGQW